MPTYNYAHFIGEAIESALNQTFTDFELIIIDDVSSDNTDEVVTRYLTDPRVRYYKNEKNLGLSQNFNKSLEYANGEFIKFLLADDRFFPSLLEKFVTIMDKYPDVSLVTSNREMFGTQTKQRRLPLSNYQKGSAVIYESLKEGAGNWIGEPTTVMFRKADLSVGKFSTDYLCLVDWEMWLRLLTKGNCYIIPENLSAFRTHGSQASKLITRNFRFTFEEYRFYKMIQEKNPYNIDLKKIDIDRMVQRRATYCAGAMYKTVSSLHKKQSRKTFIEAFKIAKEEHVIMKPLLDRFSSSSKSSK